jgi:hypothetical protein
LSVQSVNRDVGDIVVIDEAADDAIIIDDD